jgi:iron complex outermembrane recepter protein
MIKSRLLTGTAILLTASNFIAGTSAAQTQSAASDANIESIIVTGSRIQVQGYEAPTPVTVVGIEALERDARPDIGDVLRELPSFGTSSGPSNSVRSTYISDGTAGLNLVSLRNLGQRRTLVLFHGQRVVDSNLTLGGTDMSTIPSSLISRVDVVTGGASASWGSNAVAGVVNVILDTKLDGVKVNLQAGNTWDMDRQEYEAEVAYGTPFANGRGHFIIAGNASYAPDTFFNPQIKGIKYTRLLQNPRYGTGAGQTTSVPRIIHVDWTGPVSATPGGIITNCSVPGQPAGTPCPLKGTYFDGPSANPLQFDYGTFNGSYTGGGTPNFRWSQAEFGAIANPNDTETLFNYGSYEVTDDITASYQLNYGRFHTIGNSWSTVQAGTLTIQRDNAFLPASVASRMDAIGLTSFSFGSTMTGDAPTNEGSNKAQADNLGMPVVDLYRQLYRGTFALDGKTNWFDNAWTWNAYFQHGEARGFNTMLNNPQTANFRAAIDAVRVTAANVGASGLPIGSIACRSTLTNPTNGCAPWDAFGTGKDNTAAEAYINKEARAGNNYMHDVLSMDVWAASATGALPFGLPAGNISSAFGLEYRREKGVQIASAASRQRLFFGGGNHSDFYGKSNTKEAFVEFSVPLLNESVVQSLDFDVAGRYTDYSFSGKVGTYKFGLLSQVNDLLRVRGSYSHDIRAPGLFELYSTGQLIANSAIDPRTGLVASIFSVTQGNLNLKPEIGNTITMGAVITPTDLIPGLRVSIDWWKIKMTDVIFTAGLTQTLAQCAAGVQTFCNNLVFEGPETVPGRGPSLTRINLQPVNAALQKTAGWDFSTDYTMPLFAGDFTVRALGTYLYQDLQDSLGIRFDAIGNIGGDARRGSSPKFKGTLSGTYAQDAWSLTAQMRVVGKAVLNKEWVEGVDVDDNTVPAIAYMDLRGAYDLNENMQFYFAVDNVLDKAPPVVTSTVSNSWYAPFRDELHDVFGRRGRLGVRMRF